MNSQKINYRRNRLAALISLAVILAAAIFFATPQGRALAQDVLKFFLRSPQNTLPLPTLAVPLVTVASPTAAYPTLGKPTGTTSLQVSPTPGSEYLLPFQKTCGNLYLPKCSLAEIRSMVDFPLYELATAPQGTQLAGATGGPQQVTLVYTGEGLNGGLWLQEGPVAAGEQQVWKIAANTTVEAVSVGSAAGEYVEGGWFAVETNDGRLSWHVDSGARTLRWEAGGLRYSLVFLAGKNITGSLLDKAALLDLAGHLVIQNAEAALPSPTPALSLEQLSQRTGFDVRLPAWVPGGYVFQEAAYSPQRNGACLYYRYQEGIDGWPLLTIFETSAARTPSLAEIKNDPIYLENGKEIEIPMDASPLPVGGAKGGVAQFMGNGVDAAKLCSYPGLIGNRALVWQANGKGYVIFGLLDQFQGHGFISHLEMQRLAESLTGVNTIPAGTIDPERLRTLEDAETLAGFPVKEPTQMLAGMYFDHAVVRTSDKLKEVYLIYTGAPNGDGRRYGFFFSQAVGETQSLEETFLAGGYENLTIAAQPGIYREICWSNNLSGATECNQEATWFEGGTRFDIQAYLPGAMEKADFLSIAESMR